MTAKLNQVLQSTSEFLFPAELGNLPITLESVGFDGDTPLHALIRQNDTEEALLVLQAGGKVNALGDMGETPLHVAIRQKNTQLVKALLSAGARTDMAIEFGRTPVRLAELNGVDLNTP